MFIHWHVRCKWKPSSHILALKFLCLAYSNYLFAIKGWKIHGFTLTFLRNLLSWNKSDIFFVQQVRSGSRNWTGCSLNQSQSTQSERKKNIRCQLKWHITKMWDISVAKNLSHVFSRMSEFWSGWGELFWSVEDSGLGWIWWCQEGRQQCWRVM